MAWFAEREVTVQRVLSDNGSAYKSHAWREACTELGIAAKHTRPYRPPTTGKIERFHLTRDGQCSIDRPLNGVARVAEADELTSDRARVG